MQLSLEADWDDETGRVEVRAPAAAKQSQPERALCCLIPAVVVDVHFRLTGKAEGLAVAPPTGELANIERNDITLAFSIEVNDVGNETDDCVLVATTAREVTQEAYELFTDELKAERDDPTGDPDAVPVGGVHVFPAHTVRWIFDPPAPLVLLCGDVYAELHWEAARLVQMLRWLYNRPWPAQPLTGAYLEWSLDGKGWHSAPGGAIDVFDFGSGDAELDEAGVEAIGHLWESGELVEPLARQILLEAVALASDNPRAALVLAVAAAEIGVKQFAGAGSASASEGWLISSLQSPPLTTLISRYLPFFTEKKTNERGEPSVPQHVTRSMEKAVKIRNRIIHSGGDPPNEEELWTIFAAVNDLLYLLDWFAGHEWAFAHLQDETKAAYESSE